MRKKILKTLKSPPELPESERIAELFPNFKISNNISEITTPYVFFIKDPFDFQPEEANFHRMILQAEEQRFVKTDIIFGAKFWSKTNLVLLLSSDIVAGAWVNQNGHWHQSCFQIELRKYEMSMKSGYFKSINRIRNSAKVFKMKPNFMLI